MRVKMDGEGRIGQDLVCVSCGYNLRGLDPAAACPECGRLVSNSARGNLLGDQDPAWLEQLASGTVWLRAAPLALLVAFFAVPYVVELLVKDVAVRNHFLKSAGPMLHYVVPLLAASVPGMIGCWRLTTPEPDVADASESRKTSTVARWIIVACWVAWLALVVGPEGLLGQWVVLGWVTLWPIGFSALLTHLRELALRVPDDRLARDTRFAVGAAIVWNVFFGIWLFFLAGRYRVHLRELTAERRAARQADLRVCRQAISVCSNQGPPAGGTTNG